MSQNVAVFHSSEVDDASLLADGYYVGFVRYGSLTADGALGPFATLALAILP